MFGFLYNAYAWNNSDPIRLKKIAQWNLKFRRTKSAATDLKLKKSFLVAKICKIYRCELRYAAMEMSKVCTEMSAKSNQMNPAIEAALLWTPARQCTVH